VKTDPLHTWLKASAAADVAHYIIWRGGEELRGGCQLRLEASRAALPRNGVRLCEVCWADLRSRKKYAEKRRERD
jgi:hypothetical protein